MKPWRTWLACLGVLGALTIIGGCGSGDVPDPGSDGQAASAPGEGSAPPQPIAPAAAPAQKVAAAEAKPEEGKPEEPAGQAEAPPPAQGQAGGNAQSGDRNSATAEMLKIATADRPAPPADGAAAGGANAPGGGAAPGGAGAPGGAAPPGGGMGRPGMGPPGGPGGMGPNAGGMAAGMGGQMQQQQQAQAQMQASMKQMQGGMAAQMKGQMPGGMAAGGPGGGQGGGADKEPDFGSPQGAVQAFLDALKAKDLNRLTEATALRAQTESGKRNQETFKRIFEGTLSQSELDKLAARLDDYQITGMDQPKSSNTWKVILSKRGTGKSTNSMFQIVITTRLEKKGWGVSDISNPSELKNPNYQLPKRNPRRL